MILLAINGKILINIKIFFSVFIFLKNKNFFGIINGTCQKMFVQNEYHNEKMQNNKGYLEEYIYYTFVGFTNLLCIQSMYVFNPFVFVIYCGGVGKSLLRKN